MTVSADTPQEPQGASPAANTGARTVVVLPAELDPGEPVWRPWLDAWAERHGADTAPIIAAVREGRAHLFLTAGPGGPATGGIAITTVAPDASGRRRLRVEVLYGAGWSEGIADLDIVARAWGLFGVTLSVPPEYADAFAAAGFTTGGMILCKRCGAQ